MSLLVKGLDAEVQNRANANNEINAYKEFIQDGDDGDGFEDVDDDDDYEDDKVIFTKKYSHHNLIGSKKK